VGVGGKKLRLGIAVSGCALVTVAAAGPAAAERTSPKPQPSPRAHPLIHAEAAPSAPAPQGATTSGTRATGFSPTVTSASSSPRVVVVTHSRTRTVSKPPARHRSKADPPPKVSSRPVRELASWLTGRNLVATSAHGLAAPASSSESMLLLLIGLGLVVLVLGETTLLRRAARPTAPQRGAEEPLPIRRVQLRR
jgi:hypothetical protein